MQVDNFVFRDIEASRINLVSYDFSPNQFKKELEINADGLRYKDITVDTLSLKIGGGFYSILLSNDDGLLKLNGQINQDKKGAIDDLYLKYREIETSNDRPITFDLNKPELGNFRLFFIDGLLEGNIKEGKIAPVPHDLCNHSLTNKCGY